MQHVDLGESFNEAISKAFGASDFRTKLAYLELAQFYRNQAERAGAVGSGPSPPFRLFR